MKLSENDISHFCEQQENVNLLVNAFWLLVLLLMLIFYVKTTFFTLIKY